MQVTTKVWQFEPGMARPLRDLTGWLVGHSGTTTKGTGNFRQAPCEALEEAGPQVELFHVQHVRRIRGRKTDRNDSIRLARVCRYGLTTPGHVPPREFAEPRRQCRNRRKLVADRVRVCNRLGKTLDHDSPRLGGALTDLPGRNGGASSTASSRSVRPIASSKA